MSSVLVVPVRSTSSAMVKLVKKVVAGIVRNPAGEILIAKRQAHQNHPNCWEFPGGKVEPGETHYHALVRELCEEVGLQIRAAEEFQCIDHDYGVYFVELTVYLITDFLGEAHGVEGQEIRWVSADALSQFTFPEANQSLIELLRQS